MIKKCKIFALLLFVTIAFIFSSCEKELYQETIKNENLKNLKLESKSFKELLQLPTFNNAYQKIANRKLNLNNSLTARTALEDQFGFTIVEDKPIKVITDQESTTFVILIKRETKEDLKFENLLINVKDTSMVATILKYTLSQPAIYVQEHESYSMDIVQTELAMLAFEGKTTTDDDCIDISTVMCDAIGDGFTGPHVANQNCMNFGQGLYLVWSTFCFGSTGGSGSGSGDSSGGWTPFTGYGVGPHGGGGNPISVSPIVSDEDVLLNGTTPCDKIKNKSKEIGFKNSINNLNVPLYLQSDHEIGYGEVTQNGNKLYSLLVSDPSTHRLNIPTGMDISGFIHVHNDDWIDYNNDNNLIQTVKMFSPTDIYTLVVKTRIGALHTGVPIEDTYGIMISSEGIFAMNILAPIPQSTLNSIDFEKFKDKFNNLAEKIITDTGNNLQMRKEKLQKALLNYLKDTGLDNYVGLYERISQPNPINPDIPNIKWDRRTLSPNNTLINNPC